MAAASRTATALCLAAAVLIVSASAALPSAKASGKSEWEARLGEAVSNVNGFGFRLLEVLDDANGDPAGTFYSPVSVSTALGMLSQGATVTSQTLDQISEAFRGLQVKGNYSSTEGALFHFVLNDAAGHASGTRNDPEVDIDMANAAWFNVSQPIKSSYKSALRDLYGASVRNLTTGDEINSWVERRTNGLISDVVPSGPVDAAGVLVNAVYFKGAWQKPFDKERTEEGIFYTPSGKIPAQMMVSKSGSYPHEKEAVIVPETSPPGNDLAFLSPLHQMMVSKSGSYPHEKEAVIVPVNIPTGEGTATLETKVVEYDFGDKEEYSAVIVLPNLTQDEKEALTDTSKLDMSVPSTLGAVPPPSLPDCYGPGPALSFTYPHCLCSCSRIIARLSKNPGEWDRWMGMLAEQSNARQETVLRLPRFKMETDADLVGSLAELGITAPFAQIPGEFSDICGDPQ
eukprot:CAMPEP_0117676562 /NCGR_PEP_ID=MMETSP0804-20121206/16241_1 /TAXON_ID=1074897 /ORGANISM="Tetraselmis astigmatica, Strain CCMP880" /LENGTH=456 /DNA_ID=CAMNT_0005485713 /DNA_START=220 /DNA_END=1588 /DNA_ORIENTATION=+